MKNGLILTIMLVFALVGCEEPNKEDKVEKSVETSSEVVEDKKVEEIDLQETEQESTEEYDATLSEVVDYLSINLDSYVQLISMSSVEPTITGTAEYQSKIAEISNALQDNLEQLETLEVPNAYEESHEVVLNGVREYNYSARKFLESISSGDDIRMAEALAHIDKGVEYMNQFAKLLNEHVKNNSN